MTMELMSCYRCRSSLLTEVPDRGRYDGYSGYFLCPCCKFPLEIIQPEDLDMIIFNNLKRNIEGNHE